MKTEYGTLGENISEKYTVPINKRHLFRRRNRSERNYNALELMEEK